ncbi:hypothetical protein AB9F36_23785 [Rhizobium leguminosarum]|uniref:hypothetical protein n=1 Tax=Rhizobium leguminosarum TaxID=384 RepID=UPI003F9967B9
MPSIYAWTKPIFLVLCFSLVSPLSSSAGLLSALERGVVKTAEKGAATAAKNRIWLSGPRGTVLKTLTSAMLAAIPAGAIYVGRNGDTLVTYIGKSIGEEISLTEASWKNKLGKLANQAAGNSSPPRIVFDEATAKALANDLDGLSSVAELYILNEAAGLSKLQKVTGVGWAFEVTPELVIPLAEEPLQKVILDYLNSAVEPGRVKFVTTMTKNDADAFQRLGNAAGDKLVSLDELKPVAGAFELPGERGSVVVFIGHVEGNAYAVRLPNGELNETISFDMIEAAAQQKGMSAIFVGCDTYACSGVSGTTAEIRETEILNAFHAISLTKTNAELFAGFGTKDRPFVLTSDAISTASNEMQFRLDRLPTGASEVRGGAISIRVVAAIIEEAEYLAWKMGMSFYIGGALLAWAMQRLDRHSVSYAFEAVYPTIDNKTLYPKQYFFQAALRRTAFYTLAPVVVVSFFALVVITAVNFSFSAWKSRESIMEFIWSLIVIPHKVLFALSIVLSDFIIVCISPFVALMVCVTASVMLSEIYGWTILLIGLAVVAAVIYYSYKNRAVIIETVDRLWLSAAKCITCPFGYRFFGPIYISLKILPSVSLCVYILAMLWIDAELGGP